MGIPTRLGGVVPAMTGVYVLLFVLVAATLFGLWRKRTDGRMRTVSPGPVPANANVAGGAGVVVAPDDSEPLIVDGHPIEVVDHTLIPAADVLGPADLGQPLGEQATLLQFSSAFCAPCRYSARGAR